MPSRKLEDLCPVAMAKFLELKKVVYDRLGLDIIATSTIRIPIEQAALYAQGRESLEFVNYLRDIAGLRPISEERNKRTVTDTLWSIHLFACAWDYCIVKGGKASWDVKADVNGDDIPDYEQVCDIAEELGIETGRAYGDYVHCQVTGGLSLDELKAGKRPA